MIIISEIREQVKKKETKGLRYFHVLGKTEVLYHSVIAFRTFRKSIKYDIYKIRIQMVQQRGSGAKIGIQYRGILLYNVGAAAFILHTFYHTCQQHRF